MHSKLYIRLMNSARWRLLRNEYLSEHPLCECCKASGKWVPAQCVHHVTPIESGRTDAECERLAFSRANLQALCFGCHSDIHRSERSHSTESHQARARQRLDRWVERQRRRSPDTAPRDSEPPGVVFSRPPSKLPNPLAKSPFENQDFQNSVFPTEQKTDSK